MPSCRQLSLAGVLLLPALALVGCSAERAVRVSFDVAVPGDALCVLAGDGRSLTFVQRYPSDALPDPATLTFVAGSPTRRDVVVGAFMVQGGRVTGSGHVAVSLASGGTLDRSLRVQTCRMGAPTGFGVSPSGTFATLSSSSRMLAADFDGDGRDELLGIGTDGALQLLDAEDPTAGSRRVSELMLDGRLVGSGDFDGDCHLDLLAAGALGLFRVLGSDGSSPAPLGAPDPVDATVLELVAGTGPALAIASPAGVHLLYSVPIMTVELAPEGASFVVAADLDGDGQSDLVSGGPGAPTRIFLGGRGSYTEQVGAGSGLLSEASGPAVQGDFDGDGLEDVALVEATGLRILSFGSGSLGSIPVDVAIPSITRIAAGDLDGDCVTDLVVLEGTVVHFFRGSAAGLVEGPGPTISGTLDLVVADVDGDGAHEAALLAGGGRVNLWRP